MNDLDNIIKLFLNTSEELSYSTTYGDVESPQGFFGFFYVAKNLSVRWQAINALDPNHELDWREISPGWYFASINSDGLVYYERYGRDEFMKAFEAFRIAQRAHNEWLDNIEV